MHVNGIANKFSEPDESVIASARSLADPLFENQAMQSMPVFSSGQTIRQAQPTWNALHSPDLIYTAGGGVVAHPQGVAAGVEALQQAWQAASTGESIEQRAKLSPALLAALDAYPA